MPAPQPPTNVEATSLGNFSRVRVTWTATVSANADGYYIYRRAVAGEWTRLATVMPRTETRYEDTGCGSGDFTAYEYRLTSFDGSVEGAPSVASNLALCGSF